MNARRWAGSIVAQTFAARTKYPLAVWLLTVLLAVALVMAATETPPPPGVQAASSASIASVERTRA